MLQFGTIYNLVANCWLYLALVDDGALVFAACVCLPRLKVEATVEATATGYCIIYLLELL